MTFKATVDSGLQAYRSALADADQARVAIQQAPLGLPVPDPKTRATAARAASSLERVVSDSEAWLPGNGIEPTSYFSDAIVNLVFAGVLIIVGVVVGGWLVGILV